MTALDYFLLFCTIALLGVSYFLNTKANFELAALVNLCAFAFSGAVGARIGGRIQKKNQENE